MECANNIITILFYFLIHNVMSTVKGQESKVKKVKLMCLRKKFKVIDLISNVVREDTNQQKWTSKIKLSTFLSYLRNTQVWPHDLYLLSRSDCVVRLLFWKKKVNS